jgi:hypothetical protein
MIDVSKAEDVRLSEFLAKIEVLPKRVTKMGTIPESLLRREKLFEHVLPPEPLLMVNLFILDVLRVMMRMPTEGFHRGGSLNPAKLRQSHDLTNIFYDGF